MENPVAIIADMVREAERHADALAEDRVRALEYYRGEMKDTPSDEGRSKMVKRVVRAHIKKVLPSISRTILGSDQVVEFQPGGEGDEEGAAQASDYINFVVLRESGAEQAIHDAIHDALLLRNGILKWWWEEKQAVKISSHSGLPDDAFAALAGDDGVEVLEHTEREETTQEGPVLVHDCRIRRAYTERCARAAAVPRERFLIHPDAVRLDDSLLTGEKTEMRRSDLIAMGYDRELVDTLPLSDDDKYEEDSRRDVTSRTDEAQRANDPVDYYDLYIRIDMDGDGIAEQRHMCFAGGLTEKNLLLDEECDEVQFADICVMRQPHQWEGISLADDLMDLQRAETVLMRQTLDNIYWSNNPQPVVQKDAIEDMDAVYNPEFGKPIVVKAGFDAKTAVSYNTVPFVADKSFSMLEYLDGEATDRTGVSDASAGLAPDALQNMTAKASAMIEQAGIGQAEMMVRTVANGLERFFGGLYRMIVRHQDVPRTVRLRNEWVQFDPRHWDADMDVVVNVGLGAGTRERDMMMMQIVMTAQKELLAGFGPNNPFVKPDNLWNALSKMVESAGLKTPSLYFTEPDPEEVQAMLKAQANKPDPETMKIQAQKEIEAAKAQGNVVKEKAQMEADLMTKRADIEADARRQANELQSKVVLQANELAWEREKFGMELAMRREEAKAQREADAQARQDEIHKAQAEGFTPKVAAE